MSYFILRDGLQYGPYSRTELQRYLQTGELYPGDLGRSQEVTQWLPVSQLLGTGPHPPPTFQAFSSTQVHLIGSETREFEFGSVKRDLPPRTALPSPEPPAMHWGVLLALTVLTCGIFGWIWSFVVARWSHTINPHCSAIPILVFSAVLNISAAAALHTGYRASGTAIPAALLLIAGIALFVTAMFEIRRSVHSSYVPVQESPFELSGAMTFFFSVVYFQFKFNRARIATRHSQLHTDGLRNTP